MMSHSQLSMSGVSINSNLPEDDAKIHSTDVKIGMTSPVRNVQNVAEPQTTKSETKVTEAEAERLERLIATVLSVSNVPVDADAEDESENDALDSIIPEDAQVASYLAVSFEEALNCEFADCASWTDAQDWVKPVSSWLDAENEDLVERITAHPRALTCLTEGLFALFSLRASVTSRAKYVLGEHVMAVLRVDGEWHPAIIEQVIEESTDVSYSLRFTEYGAPQITPESDISIDAEAAALTENDLLACVVCHRARPLTFHHLVPKETHDHVLKRNGKALVPVIEALYEMRPPRFEAKSRKDWLEVYGINVCRKCHNQIHRVESNITLALKFNSLEAVLSHPEIAKWRAWARLQK